MIIMIMIMIMIMMMIIIIHTEIKVTLPQKCCRGTVQRAVWDISHVCSHSNSNNLRNHVRSSLKDARNSSVFICRLNAITIQQYWQTPAEHSRPCSGNLKCSIAEC